MEVAILLSIYNDKKFLKELIHSIKRQTYIDWKLYLRNDGSNKTNIVYLLKKLKKTDPRISHFDNSKINIGPQKSFMRLLENVDADYYFFADQDDIWLPNKIERTLEIVKQYDDNAPLCFFSDAYIIDENGIRKDKSLWESTGINPKIAKKWKNVIAHNVATGCTMCINRAGKNVVLPFIIEDMMHDHWIVTNISKNGIVCWTNEKLMEYRIHSNNVCGIKNKKSFFEKLKNAHKISENISSVFGDISYLNILLRKLFFMIEKKIRLILWNL